MSTSPIALEKQFSSGWKTYSGEAQINISDITPQVIFDLAFGNTSGDFFSNLLNRSGYPNATISATLWHPVKHHDKTVKALQRCITITSTPNRAIAFFTKKNVNIPVHQTALLGAPDKIVVYSVRKFESEFRSCNYSAMDKWEIVSRGESASGDISSTPGGVTVRFSTCLVSHFGATLTLAKSKSMRHSQNHFQQWRILVKEALVMKGREKEQDAMTKALLPEFQGKWVKVNSYFEIRIEADKIRYEDGSIFRIQCEKRPKPNEKNQLDLVVRALYTDGPFEGILTDDKQRIRWSNGSLWIRNGFSRFAGEYVTENGEKRIIHPYGVIEETSESGSVVKSRFLLSSDNQIMYVQNKSTIRGKFLGGDTTRIKWDNNSTWTKRDYLTTPRPSRKSIDATAEMEQKTSETKKMRKLPMRVGNRLKKPVKKSSRTSPLKSMKTKHVKAEKKEPEVLSPVTEMPGTEEEKSEVVRSSATVLVPPKLAAPKVPSQVVSLTPVVTTGSVALSLPSSVPTSDSPSGAQTPKETPNKPAVPTLSADASRTPSSAVRLTPRHLRNVRGQSPSLSAVLLDEPSELFDIMVIDEVSMDKEREKSRSRYGNPVDMVLPSRTKPLPRLNINKSPRLASVNHSEKSEKSLLIPTPVGDEKTHPILMRESSNRSIHIDQLDYFDTNVDDNEHRELSYSTSVSEWTLIPPGITTGHNVRTM